jgi:hypothetical protein
MSGRKSTKHDPPDPFVFARLWTDPRFPLPLHLRTVCINLFPDEVANDVTDVKIRVAAVVGTDGVVLGRFDRAADAVFAMNAWPHAYAVICGGRMIACRDDRMDWMEGRAA